MPLFCRVAARENDNMIAKKPEKMSSVWIVVVVATQNLSFSIDNVNDDQVDDDCNIVDIADIVDIVDISINTDLMMHIMMFILMDELNDCNDWSNSNNCRWADKN